MENNVSLVIVGRNTAPTARSCLEAVVPLLLKGQLDKIIYVDDGSQDETVRVVRSFPVCCMKSVGRGPGAARNIGWRAAESRFVWFLDGDCIPQPDALFNLMRHMEDPKVGAAGGSLLPADAASPLAQLVHEEIMVRHRSMGHRVDFLAAANVVYRRELLELLNGFDERFIKAQDAELAFRTRDAGYELAFDPTSLVTHHYTTGWSRYLYSQGQQGYWRVRLHLLHPGHAVGDSYSNIVDHVQPPLALLVLLTLPLAFFEESAWIPATLVVLLAAGQAPMSWRLVRQRRRARYLCFAALGFVRAFWRGIGMAIAILLLPTNRFRR